MPGNANQQITGTAAAVIMGIVLFFAGLFVVELPGEVRFISVFMGPVLIWAGIKGST